MNLIKTILVFATYGVSYNILAIDEVIVVTADRNAVDELNSAYSTEIIYQDQLVNAGYRSTVDVIGSVSGVLLQKTAHGQGSPYIRGFTGFRNLFLVDGIRLNNSVFREGPNQYWNTIDPFSIEKFEIVKGPTSVAYGSDAIGGTVNAISRVQTIDQVTLSSPGTFLYRGSTAEQSHQIRGSYDMQLSENSVLSLGATDKKFGNLIAGGDTNEQHNTGYDEYNIDLKWLLSISDKWLLSSAYFKTKQENVPRTHKTIYSKSYSGTTIGNELRRDLDQTRELLYFKLSGQELNSLFSNADLTFSYQNQSESRDRLRTKDRHDFQGVDVDTFGLNLNFVTKMKKNNLIYGVEYYQDEIDSFSSKNTIQGPVADNARYKWLGIYAQNKHNWYSKVDIDFGLRWNYMTANSDKVADPLNGDQISLDKSWHNIVANLRVNYKLTPDSKSIYVGISQGFRAPNLSDLTRFDSARTNEFEVPSPDLKSEHFITLDSGIKFRSEQLDYDLALYYTDIHEQIQRIPTGKQNEDGEFEITKKNLGDGYAYGGEIDLRYKINEQLSITTNIAFLEGKVDTYPSSTPVVEREYLDRLMPLNARVSLSYSPSEQNWWLNSELIGFEKADKLSTRDKSDGQRIPPNGTPGYVIWNINAGYTITESLKLSFNVHNVLDKNYRVHGSGQNEAGTNLIGSVTYSF